jgi:hypothetical protein
MTIIALTLNATRGLIASDTLSYLSDGAVFRQGDGSAVHVDKVHEMAHAHCVFVNRGSSALGHYLYDRSREVKDIEGAIERFPELLRSGWRALGLEEFYKDKLYKGRPHRHSCYLIGWSSRAGSMLGATFERSNAFAAQAIHAPPNGQGIHLYDPYHPKPIGIDAFPPHDADTLAQFVRLHLGRARDEEPSVPYGGRLALVEVDREGMRRRDMGDLGMPARLPMRTLGTEPALMIAANAATEVYDVSFNAGVITQSAGGGPAGAVVHSVTLTPSVSGRLIVTVSFDSQTTGGGSNWGSTGSKAFVKQAGVAPFPYEAYGPTIPMSTTRQSQTTQAVFNVSGGTSCEFGLYSVLDASTGNWWNVSVSGELIKR